MCRYCLPYFVCVMYPWTSQINGVHSVHVSGSACQKNPTDTYPYWNNFPLFNTYLDRKHISQVRVLHIKFIWGLLSAMQPHTGCISMLTLGLSTLPLFSLLYLLLSCVLFVVWEEFKFRTGHLTLSLLIQWSKVVVDITKYSQPKKHEDGVEFLC